MGLFGRRKDEWVDPTQISPQEALRLAREGMAATGTYVDEHGRRRKVGAAQRAQMESVFDKLEAAQPADPD
jgi:hypothetical protein